MRFVALPFRVGGGGPVESAFEQAASALASGEKTTQTFVREWANSGELYVVRTSQLLGPARAGCRAPGRVTNT